MFDPNDFFINPKNVKSNDRFTHFAVAAARQALKDAGLGDTPATLENPERIGVMVGSAFGGMETFERETLKLASKPERPKVSKKKTTQKYFKNSCLSEALVRHRKKAHYINRPFFNRYLRSQFRRFWETRPRESLELNVVARVPTTDLFLHVPVEVIPLGKPWE